VLGPERKTAATKWRDGWKVFPEILSHATWRITGSEVATSKKPIRGAAHRGRPPPAGRPVYWCDWSVCTTLNFRKSRRKAHLFGHLLRSLRSVAASHPGFVRSSKGRACTRTTAIVSCPEILDRFPVGGGSESKLCKTSHVLTTRVADGSHPQLLVARYVSTTGPCLSRKSSGGQRRKRPARVARGCRALTLLLGNPSTFAPTSPVTPTTRTRSAALLHYSSRRGHFPKTLAQHA
jgi:hypothetical protein